LGSLERFVALLAEWYGGAFPVWLSPAQVRVIPVSEERHLDYAQEIKSELDKSGFRTELDERKETLQRKIRDAHLEKIKIPYMLIIGDEEVKNATVSVRLRTEEDLGEWTLAKFIQVAKEVEDNKYLTLLPT
jgi:threonyl-tRNA synthetase